MLPLSKQMKRKKKTIVALILKNYFLLRVSNFATRKRSRVDGYPLRLTITVNSTRSSQKLGFN